MNTTPTQTSSAWTEIADQIALLLQNDPIIGLATILLTTIVFFAVVVGGTWAITKIIKSRKQPLGPTFQQDVFTRNVMKMVQQMVDFHDERDRLSRKHTILREHTLIRDQMTVADGALDYIESDLLVKMNKRISEELETNVSPTQHSVYREYSLVIPYILEYFRKEMRRIAIENHLAERKNAEFDKYVNNKLDHAKIQSVQLFKSLYSSQIIKADQLIDDFENRDWNVIREQYKGALMEMREIAIRYDQQIKQEEKEFQERWSNFVSQIPEILSEGITK